LNPHIPFYRLPEAMREIEELQGRKPIRLTIRDVCACLRLKLWDPDEDRMVPFMRPRACARRHPALEGGKEA
jgi:omega-6 fatty acid desaturase (delta-12 desaturase)